MTIGTIPHVPEPSALSPRPEVPRARPRLPGGPYSKIAPVELRAVHGIDRGLTISL